MNPEIELIIKARNEARAALNQLNKQIKALEDQMGSAGNRARRFSSSIDRIAPVLLDINRAGAFVSRGLFGIGRNLVQAAANFETYENTIRVFSNSQAEANRTIEDLIQFSKELVGLDTGDIIKFYGRISQLGLTSEETIAAIRGVTNGIAEQGKSTADARRTLEQFTQALGNVKPLATDFKTVFREVPQIVKAIELAFGQTARSAEEFRNVLADLGLTWQEARPQLIEALDAITVGANIDTLNAQFDILQDQAAVTAASFGKILVPSVVSVIKQIVEWLNVLEDLEEDQKRLILEVGAATLALGLLSAAIPVVAFTIKAFTVAIAILAKEFAVLVTVMGITWTAIKALIVPTLAVSAIFGAMITNFKNASEASRETEKSIRDLTQTFTQVSQIQEYNKAIAEQRMELIEARKTLLSYRRGVEGIGPGGRPLISEDAIPQKVIDGLKEVDERIVNLRGSLITSPTRGGQLRQVESEITRLTDLYKSLRESGLEPTNERVIEIRNQIQALRRIQESYNETTEESTEAVRNLVLELVKADTELRRARTAARQRDPQTIDIIERQTAAQVAAINKVADLEVEQAEKDIQDQSERAAKIQEIRDKQVDDIAAAEQRGQDRIKKYEDAVFKARIQSGESFVANKKAQIKRISDANIRALVIDANARAVAARDDKEREDKRIAEGVRRLSLQANADAKRVALETSREKALTTLFENEEFQKVASAQFGIEQILSLWQDRREAARALQELETSREKEELEKRKREYARYFQYINRLNLESTEAFISSAVAVTATIIRQILIQEAVKAAASGNIFAAIGLGAGALATSGVEAFVSGAFEPSSRLSGTTTFHNAMNDSLVQIGVNRALTSRSNVGIDQQAFMNNRKQAQDVSNAIDEGIRDADIRNFEGSANQPIIIRNQLVIDGKVIREWDKTVTDYRGSKRVGSRGR